MIYPEASRPINPEFWHGKRVLITGGHGFLGTHLNRALLNTRASVFLAQGDLAYKEDARRALDYQPSIVFHLAADVGGIGHNAKSPASILYNNLLVDTHVVRACAVIQPVQKLVCVGSTCAYPANAPIPIREESFWQGEPEITNAAYGHAKRLLLANLQAHHTQYGLNFAYLVLANLYGEGQSDDAEHSHVIPALIRKVRDTSTDTIHAWGTGHAVREFLHVEDAVNALVLAAERETPPEPINIGSGTQITIRELLRVIQYFARDTREVVWDATRPDGQSERLLDLSRARTLLGWHASTLMTGELALMVGQETQPA